MMTDLEKRIMGAWIAFVILCLTIILVAVTVSSVMMVASGGC